MLFRSIIRAQPVPAQPIEEPIEMRLPLIERFEIPDQLGKRIGILQHQCFSFVMEVMDERDEPRNPSKWWKEPASYLSLTESVGPLYHQDMGRGTRRCTAMAAFTAWAAILTTHPAGWAEDLPLTKNQPITEFQNRAQDEIGRAHV